MKRFIKKYWRFFGGVAFGFSLSMAIGFSLNIAGCSIEAIAGGLILLGILCFIGWRVNKK